MIPGWWGFLICLKFFTGKSNLSDDSSPKTLWSHFYGRHILGPERQWVFGPLLVCLFAPRNSGILLGCGLLGGVMAGSWLTVLIMPCSQSSHEFCSPLFLHPPAPRRLAWSIQRTEERASGKEGISGYAISNGNCFPQAQFFPCPQWELATSDMRNGINLAHLDAN